VAIHILVVLFRLCPRIEERNKCLHTVMIGAAAVACFKIVEEIENHKLNRSLSAGGQWTPAVNLLT